MTQRRRLLTFGPDGLVQGDVESYANDLPDDADEAQVDTRMVPFGAVDVTALDIALVDKAAIRAMHKDEIQAKVRNVKEGKPIEHERTPDEDKDWKDPKPDRPDRP